MVRFCDNLNERGRQVMEERREIREDQVYLLEKSLSRTKGITEGSEIKIEV